MLPHQILLLTLGILFLIFVLIAIIEIIIDKKTPRITSFTNSNTIYGKCTTCVIIVGIILLITWAQMSSTRKHGKVEYITTITRNGFVEFPLVHKEVTAFVKEKQKTLPVVTQNKSKKKSKNNNKESEKCQDWEGIAVHVGDSVRVIGEYNGKCYVVLKDGSYGLISNNFLDLDTECIERLSLKSRRSHQDGGKLMSEDAFRKLICGKTIDQIDPDSLYRIEVTKNVYEESFAIFAFKVFDSNTGTFYRPTIQFNQQGMVKGYSSTPLNTHWNAWILKHIPFVNWIYDQEWLTWICNQYKFASPELFEWSNDGFGKTVIGIIGWLIGIIFYCIVVGGWLALVSWIPMLLLCSLIRFRYIYPYSNKVLSWVVSILGCICASVSSIVILAEYSWVIYIPLSLLGLGLCGALLGDILSERCNRCHLMYTKRLNKEYLDREYDTDWVDKKVKGELLSSRTKRWTIRTTTTRTTIDSDGNEHVSQSYSDRHHHRTYETNLFHDYQEKFHVKVFESEWKCSYCGNLTYSSRENSTLADRRKVGTHKEEHLVSES